jgi:hypothetical protein
MQQIASGQGGDPARLTPEQRAKWENIRNREGRNAAKKYRQGILGTNGGGGQAVSEPGVTGQGGGFVQPNDPKYNKGDFKGPGAIANTQDDANQYAAEYNMWANRPNETNAYGSLNYTTGPNGEIIREAKLSDANQAILEGRQGIDQSLQAGVQGLTGQMGKAFNFNSSYDPRKMAGFDGRQRIENQIYNRQKGLMDEQFGQEKNQLMQNLADRGITEGSELYNKELERFDRSRQDAYNSSYTNAVQFGGQEQANQFNMASQGRGQQFGEQLQQWQSPYQAAGQMLGMTQGVINPQFQNMAQVGMNPVDATGIGMGMLGMQHESAMQAKQLEAQKAMASMGGFSTHSGGGGGFQYVPPPPMQPSGPSTAQTIGANIVSGMSAGLVNGMMR